MQSKEQIIFTIVVVIILLIFIVVMFLIFLTKNNLRKNRLMYENERIKKEFQETLLKSRLEIQEHTLTYVSREIHDNIGQTLSLARLQMNSDEMGENLEATDELLGKAIADLRTLSHSLNTDFIKSIGFTGAVRQLTDRFRKTGKFKINLELSEKNIEPGEEKGLILFRIIQELLNNITKHAQASEININLQADNEEDTITIADNGKGFDTKLMKSSGIGLKNISDRIRMIAGELNIRSAIGKGTEVQILLPHEKRGNQGSTRG